MTCRAACYKQAQRDVSLTQARMIFDLSKNDLQIKQSRSHTHCITHSGDIQTNVHCLVGIQQQNIRTLEGNTN